MALRIERTVLKVHCSVVSKEIEADGRSARVWNGHHRRVGGELLLLWVEPLWFKVFLNEPAYRDMDMEM
ncbi:hypothetical protein ACG7TL_005519 [Trametes sanguinea]